MKVAILLAEGIVRKSEPPVFGLIFKKQAKNRRFLIQGCYLSFLLAEIDAALMQYLTWLGVRASSNR